MSRWTFAEAKSGSTVDASFFRPMADLEGRFPGGTPIEKRLVYQGLAGSGLTALGEQDLVDLLGAVLVDLLLDDERGVADKAEILFPSSLRPCRANKQATPSTLTAPEPNCVNSVD